MSPRIAANSPWVCSEPDCQNPVSTPTTLRCRACWAKSEHRRVGSAACAMDGCEALVKARGLCDRHYRRPSDVVHHKKKDRCQVCDVPINDGSTLCRTHYLAAKKPTKTCECGAALSVQRATQCRACWMRDHMAKTSRPKCSVCEKPISWQVGRKGNPAKRCRDCEHKRRHENMIVVLREGMAREDLADADVSRKVRLSRWWAAKFRKLIGNWPCSVCGYDEDQCEIDRIKPELGYVYGNVAQVCGNCHNKITRGKIPHPLPTRIPSLECD